MIKANFIVKEIFKEFQRLMPWSEEINNTSRLSAAGDGKVSLAGNFNLNLHLGRQVLCDWCFEPPECQ